MKNNGIAHRLDPEEIIYKTFPNYRIINHPPDDFITIFKEGLTLLTRKVNEVGGIKIFEKNISAYSNLATLASWKHLG